MRKILLALLLACTMSVGAQIKKFDMLTVFEQRFDLTATKINVDGQFCHVVVNATNDNRCVLIGKLEAMERSDDYKVIVDEANGEANVSVTVSSAAKSSFAGELTLLVSPNAVVNIKTESGYVDIVDVKNADITVKSNSGKLRTSGVDGKLNLATRSGEVTLKNMKGDFSVETASGTITANNMEGSINCESISGLITVTNVNGSLKSKSTSGNQDINIVRGNLNIDASSGTTKISDVEGVIKAKTYSGAMSFFKVKCEMHIETFKGQISGGKDITLTASSDFVSDQGKINMRLTNDKKELTFKLACTENKKANLMAKGTTKQKKLNEGDGPIVITATSRSSSIVFQ